MDVWTNVFIVGSGIIYQVAVDVPGTQHNGAATQEPGINFVVI